MASWYCLIDDQQYGPFDPAQLRSLAQTGRLSPQDHVRRAESGTWKPAADVRGLFQQADSATSTATGKPPLATSRVPLATSNRSRSEVPPVAQPAPPMAGPVQAAALPTAIPLQTAVAVPASSRPALPVATPVNPVTRRARDSDDRWAARRRSKQRNSLVFAGLGAALLTLIIVALLVLGRPAQRGDTIAASSTSRPAARVAPAEEADIESDPAAVPIDPSARSDGTLAPGQTRVPNISRWLQAPAQKRIVRDHMKLHVPAAWWTSDSTAPDTLVVEVEITNLSAARPLEFRGWAGGTQTGGESAIALGSGAERPLVSQPADGSARVARAPQRLAPGKSLTTRIQFPMDRTIGSGGIRLILPYSVLGLPGYVGFEIPSTMILAGPPEAAGPIAASAGDDSWPGRDPAGIGGLPETIGDLKSEIRASVQRPAAAEAADPMSVPADPPIRPTPTMQDLRQSIRESVEPAPENDQK